MKLDPESIAYILKVVNTASIVNIESIIIEPGLVRGMDDSNSVVIFHDENIPALPFGSIGLTRLNELKARYDIASSREKFSVEATQKDGHNYAASIVMKGTGLKVDYRCGNPDNIKAPRQINDEMLRIVQLNEEAVNLLQKAATAMGSDFVSIISNDTDGVSFELADVNNDVFKHTFATKVTEVVPGSTKFVHRYPIKILMAIFKKNPSGSFAVGGKGMLQFPVNGMNIYVLPQV